jgi:rod shape determining protein RodA
MKAFEKRPDYLLFLMPVFIFFVGLIFLYSASWREGQVLDQHLVFRQLLWMGMAMLVTAMSFRFHYRYLIDISWPLYFTVLLLLAVVLFMPTRMGAHRWISVGFFNLQPSELAKIAVIVAMATLMKDVSFQTAGLKRIFMVLLAAVVPVILILKEPDLGTALLYAPVILAMFYVWGLRLKWIVGSVIVALLASPLMYSLLKDYQKSRLLVFFNPEMDPLGAGYTIIQSKIALGSGGLLGKGLMSGSQTQLHFLPEKHTDFIFSVIGEEGGFIALLMVILCYWFIIYKGYRISQKSHNRYAQLLATGFTTMLAFQALINMSMTVGLLPVVGMPLLLVSYGGSSLIVSMLLIGILINIGMRRDPFI